MIYIFFKQNKYVPQTITESEVFALQRLKKGGKETTFTHGGREYYFSDIAFIGEKCHNDQCHNPTYFAHPLDQVCDYNFTGSCSTCSKELWERDRSYAIKRFGRQTCAAHSGVAFWENKGKQEPVNTQEQQEFLATNSVDDVPF